MENLTDWSNFTTDYFINNNSPLLMGDVFRDICTQLDGIILKCILLITFGYIFNMLVINRSIQYWKDPDSLVSKTMPTDLILQGVKHFSSLLETLMLGSCMVIIYIAYTQNMLGFWSYVLFGVLAFFLGLIGLVELIKKYRKWRFKKLKK